MNAPKSLSRLVILLALLLCCFVSKSHALKKDNVVLRQLEDDGNETDTTNSTIAPTTANEPTETSPDTNNSTTTAPKASPTGKNKNVTTTEETTTDVPSPTPQPKKKADAGPTSKPTAAEQVETDAPTEKQPDDVNTDEPAKSPTEADKPTNSPTTAAVPDATPEPTVASTPEPTEASIPAPEPTTASIPKATPEPTPEGGDDEDDDPCGGPIACDSCRDLGQEINRDCFWDIDECVSYNKEHGEDNAGNAFVCPEDDSPDPGGDGSPTSQDHAQPSPSPTKNHTTPYTLNDDENGWPLLIFGAVVLCCVAALVRKFFFGMPDPYGAHSHQGKYTGVSTASDEEWGWGDGGSGTEMTSQKPHGGHLHYRSHSPRSSSGGSSEAARSGTKKKGLSVKKSGMNNPLQQSRAPQRSAAVKQPAPKPQQKTDDFFEQMGLAAKPTFSKKGLGATKMAVDDFGDADWSDDGNDLDDLLDD